MDPVCDRDEHLKNIALLAVAIAIFDVFKICALFTDVLHFVTPKTLAKYMA